MKLKEKQHTINRGDYCNLEVENIYQEQIVSVYTAHVIELVEKNNTSENLGTEKSKINFGAEVLLFKFKYFPLFEFSARANLLKIYQSTPQFMSLLESIEFRYFSLYKNCVNFYVEKLSTATDREEFLKKEIEIFKRHDAQKHSYFLFHLINESPIQNPNVLINLKQLLHYKEGNNIEDINLLLDEKSISIESKERIKLVRELFSSIENIVYNRFLEFLEGEKNKIYNPLSEEVNSVIEKSRIEKATSLFNFAVINGWMDKEFKDSFIALSNGEKIKSKIIWKGSLVLLKMLIANSHSKEYKIFPIKNGEDYEFILNSFRPDYKMRKSIKFKKYKLTSLQSAKYISKKNDILLKKIFRDL